MKNKPIVSSSMQHLNGRLKSQKPFGASSKNKSYMQPKVIPHYSLVSSKQVYDSEKSVVESGDEQTKTDMTPCNKP